LSARRNVQRNSPVCRKIPGMWKLGLLRGLPSIRRARLGTGGRSEAERRLLEDGERAQRRRRRIAERARRRNRTRG
jgi:hypothetical protein